jgi:hypothetical protein
MNRILDALDAWPSWAWALTILIPTLMGVALTAYAWLIFWEAMS